MGKGKASADVHGHGPRGYYKDLAAAAREIFMERGIYDEAMEEEMIARVDAASPDLGAKIVAKAWADPAFKERLMREPRKTLEGELGIDPVVPDLVVVEQTDDVHNVFVCTLCSCYPVFVLGRPPDWYKGREYRSRVVREPRAVLQEFGVDVPAGVEVRVHDSTADMRYFVIPKRPEGTEGWSEEQLADLVTRNSMIGVGLPLEPGQKAAAAE